MVHYSQHSPRTYSSDNLKLWNPSKTLEIINVDYGGLTCVGYAPSRGRRCQATIRVDNRALIMRTLEEIAYLSPDSAAVKSRLRAIAGRALCLKNHQDQAETIMMQWQRKIQLLSPKIEQQKSAKSTQSSNVQEPMRDREMEDLKNQVKEMEATVARLQEIIDGQRYNRFESVETEESKERSRKDHQEDTEGSEEFHEYFRKLKRERRLEKERLEKERLEKERLEKERLEKERLEQERLEKEKKAKEEQQRRERERAAANERIRQRAQEIREQREREKRDKQKKEREEWDELWKTYQERWTQFRAASADKEVVTRKTIPWPVKSGIYGDVRDSNVREFFQKALSEKGDMVKIMRKECLKWHPDTRRSWLRDAQLSRVEEMMVEMICRVVTELLNNSAGRSSEFFG